MNESRHLSLEFEVKDHDRFRALQRVVEALQEDKQKQLQARTDREREAAFRDDAHWQALFDEQAQLFFRQPTEDDDQAWLSRWLATPVAKRATDPNLKRRWSLSSLIESFKNGEFEIISCQMVSPERARLTFSPFAWPYGGTEGMRILLEAFGFQLLPEESMNLSKGQEI